MSSHKNNKHNKKLKDFLGQAKNSAQPPLDDFDKEALEGFALLENEEEILDLKAQLDKRAYTEVFSEEKKALRVYWYAAAGLALVIGLSIYFVQQNGISKSDALAIQTETPATGEQIQKSITSDIEKNQALTFKQTEDLSAAQKETEMKSVREEESEKVSADPMAKGAAKGTITDKAADVGSTAQVATEMAAPVLVEATPEKKEMSKAKPNAAAPVNENDADSKNKEFVQEISSNRKSDATLSKDDSQASKITREKKRVQSEAESEPAAGAFSLPAGTTCSYLGGAEDLKKDLMIALTAQNLVKNFDATLYINEKNKVEKVILNEAANYTASQQKQLIEILKGLKNFTATGLSGKNMAEYKLKFRP